MALCELLEIEVRVLVLSSFNEIKQFQASGSRSIHPKRILCLSYDRGYFWPVVDSSNTSEKEDSDGNNLQPPKLEYMGYTLTQLKDEGVSLPEEQVRLKAVDTGSYNSGCKISVHTVGHSWQIVKIHARGKREEHFEIVKEVKYQTRDVHVKKKQEKENPVKFDEDFEPRLPHATDLEKLGKFK